MNANTIKVIIAVIITLLTIPVHSEEMCEMGTVVLLQPEATFSQKLSNPSDLAQYIQKINKKVEFVSNKYLMHAPVSGFIVIAIKSDQRSKIWLDFDREIEEKISKEMISEIERVAPPSISNGVLSFGLNYKFWRSKKFSKEFPRPAEWESLVKKNKRPMETSDIINSLWK